MPKVKVLPVDTSVGVKRGTLEKLQDLKRKYGSQSLGEVINDILDELGALQERVATLEGEDLEEEDDEEKDVEESDEDVEDDEDDSEDVFEEE